MRVYKAFTALADGRKGLTNGDVEQLVVKLGFQKIESPEKIRISDT